MSIDWIFSSSNAMHIVKECKEELFSSLFLVKKVSNVLKLNDESGHENCFLEMLNSSHCLFEEAYYKYTPNLWLVPWLTKSKDLLKFCYIR